MANNSNTLYKFLYFYDKTIYVFLCWINNNRDTISDFIKNSYDFLSIIKIYEKKKFV